MKFNKFSKKWIALIVIVALIGVGVSVAKKGKKATTQVTKEVPNVKVQKIATENISSQVQYASKLEAVQSVTVTPKSSGKIATVSVNVGDKVTAGQVLFTLDTTTINADIQKQQAALSVSKASLNDSILTNQQTVAKAQITYDNAKDAYEKQQKLYEAGAVSKKDLDDAKTTLDNASIDLNKAQTNLSLLEQNSGETQSVASVAQAAANLNSTQIQLNDATITAPIAGVVSAKSADVGVMTSASSGSVTIIDTSSLIAQITVPDKAVGKLQVGQTVPVVVTASGDDTINGVIDSISPDVDSKNNYYIVKVKINNANGSLKAGMFAKVSIPDQQKDNATIVPNEALKVENGVKYLYTVESSKIKRVVVETGIANDKTTEITTDSVKAGTEIITEGQSLLNDGEKVNVVK